MGFVGFILLIAFGLVVLCLAFAFLAKLLTPPPGWFSDDPEKAQAIWLIVCLLVAAVSAVAAIVAAPAQQTAPAPKAVAAAPASAVENPTPPKAQEFDAEAEASRQAMAARAEEVKPELAGLLRELEALRYSERFHELGFSVNNPVAVDWKKRVEEARASLEADDSLPPQVRIVPVSLLSLGRSWQRNKGRDDSEAEWFMELVKAGLNWKWDD